MAALHTLRRGAGAWIDPSALRHIEGFLCGVAPDAKCLSDGYPALTPCVVRVDEGWHLWLDPQSPIVGAIIRCARPADAHTIMVSLIHCAAPPLAVQHQLAAGSSVQAQLACPVQAH